MENIMTKEIKFRELLINEEFECWGDELINYDYPKNCKCVKISEDAAKEIGGITFLIHPDSRVFVNRTS